MYVELRQNGLITNRPYTAKLSRDSLLIKLWAATLRMTEIKNACRKHQNGQGEAPGIKE